MNCEVAREALSARLDGEQLPVPAARLDAHVNSCPGCRGWLADAEVLTTRTRQPQATGQPDLSARIVAAAHPTARSVHRFPPVVMRLVRFALAVAGLAQLLVATAQILGADFGLVAVHEHGAMTGAHLLHESTAWTLALGTGMLLAALWPRAAAGVAVLLGVHVVVLAAYIAGDLVSGAVTASRIASHSPLFVGLLLMLVICVDGFTGRRRADAAPEHTEIVLPDGASRGKKRGHVRPVNHTAA